MARAKPASGPPPLEPYVVVYRDMADHYYIVLEQSFGAVRAVTTGIGVPGLYYGCHDHVILEAHLPDGHRPRYRATDRPLQSILSGIKERIQKQGCSPEAVLLLQRRGFLTEEEIDMVKAKLESKGETAAAAKPATGKGKGNAEALAAARAAKADAGPDTRKIKIVNKENPYRADSNRAASFDALKGVKTVQDYVDAGGKKKYLSRWVEEARIELA